LSTDGFNKRQVVNRQRNGLAGEAPRKDRRPKEILRVPDFEARADRHEIPEFNLHVVPEVPVKNDKVSAVGIKGVGSEEKLNTGGVVSGQHAAAIKAEAGLPAGKGNVGAIFRYRPGMEEIIMVTVPNIGIGSGNGAQGNGPVKEG